MSIVPLKKVTLCGLVNEKTPILENLQRLGCLHLIPLQDEETSKEIGTPVRPEEAHKALRYLVDCPKKRHQVKDASNFDVESLVERVMANKQRSRDVSDRRDFFKKRIQEVEPWGDFTLPPREKLAGIRLWFYIVPCSKIKELPVEEPAWQVVHQDSQNAYVVALSKQEPDREAMPLPRTHMGTLSLSELHSQLNKAELELEDLMAKRESLTRWIFLLTKNLALAEDRAMLTQASEQTLDVDSLFAVQGWIPVRDKEKLEEFADKHSLALLTEEPKPSDSPPTLLENAESLAGGQEVVGFYQVPGYKGWDPSRVVFFSFALFFAMILSDAGYALIFGALLLFYWRKLGKSIKGRRLRMLGLFIAALSGVYGMIVGSYFGITPSEESFLALFKILDVNDFNSMMVLSVVVGVLHIALANGITAWQLRYQLNALAPLGWIAMLIGGLLLWLGNIGTESGLFLSIAPWIIGIGGAGVVLFSSSKPIKKSKDLLLRLLEGLMALTNLSKAFGDVLSYMRLFALGLASASLALTFNQLSKDVVQAVPGMGLLMALVILIAGHILNFILAVMSGFVHGLRLNFIEFYNWGVSEEGYPFRAFSKKEIQS